MTVANLKDSISSQLTGLNLSNVNNPNGIIQRSARELATLIYLPDSVNRTQVTLYDGVIDYNAPSGIYGQNIIDLRQQGMARNEADFVYRQNIETFDRNKGLATTGWNVTFENISGVQRMRVASNVPTPKIELDPMNATTNWVIGGAGSALATDNTVFWNLPDSLRFTVTGNSTSTLTNSKIPKSDFTDYKGVAQVFLAMRTPDITNLSSVQLRVGTDASNYYQVSGVTQGFLGAWVVNDWALTNFDLSKATTVGAPTVTDIEYVQLTFTHAATITNLYVGELFASLPSPHWLYNLTTSIFQASGASPSSTIVNDNDTVLLSDEPMAIFEVLCAMNIASDMGGSASTSRVEELKQKLNGVRGYRGILIQPGLLDLYRSNNPSETVRIVDSYYD